MGAQLPKRPLSQDERDNDRCANESRDAARPARDFVSPSDVSETVSTACAIVACSRAWPPRRRQTAPKKRHRMSLPRPRVSHAFFSAHSDSRHRASDLTSGASFVAGARQPPTPWSLSQRTRGTLPTRFRIPRACICQSAA
jgi:hypothetical protein